MCPMNFYSAEVGRPIYASARLSVDLYSRNCGFCCCGRSIVMSCWSYINGMRRTLCTTMICSAA